MDDRHFSFEALEVYQKCRILVRDVYRVQSHFPGEERYALGDQIRRASTSITANLAEGSGRISPKEQLHFYEISYGSLMEAYNQLILAADLKYIGENNLEKLRPEIDTVARMLNGLRSSLLTKIKESNCKPSTVNRKL